MTIRTFDTATGVWTTSQEDAPSFTPTLTPAALATEARSKRNALLASSDWTQVADAPVDQAAWATYRQALRDVPEQEGFPASVVWPTPPE